MDGVPIRFLKIILPYISPYVTHKFNTVTTTSTFPSTWKISEITPSATISNDIKLSLQIVSIILVFKVKVKSRWKIEKTNNVH
jgi:hypothetical protein